MHKSSILVVLLTASSAKADSVAELAEKASSEAPLTLERTSSPNDEDGSESESDARSASLVSFFKDPTLAKAKAAMERGKYAAALTLLETSDERAASWLRAQIHLRMRKPQAAAEELATLADRWPALRDLCLYESALVYQKLRKLDRAADQLRSVSPSSRWYARSMLMLAELEKRRRHFPEALAAASALVVPGVPNLKSVNLAAVWLNIADLARLTGDYNGEHRALLATWAFFPSAPQAQIAQRRLVGLPYPPKWKVTRAETLLGQNLNDSAMSALQPLLATLALPDPVACRANFAYGAALRKERRHARAIAALRPVVEQCPDPLLRPRAMFVLGYSESVIEPATAIATYEALERDYPAHADADDALLYAAELRRRRSDFDGADAGYAALLAKRTHAGLSAKAHFGRFWISRAQGNAKVEHLVSVEELTEQGGSHEDVLRARYWHARTLADAGQLAEAQRLYERVASEGSSSYYGLIARDRVEGDEKPTPGTATDECGSTVGAWAEVVDANPTMSTAMALLRLGHREAGPELLAVAPAASTAELRALFQVLHASGRVGSAGVVGRILLRRGAPGLRGQLASSVYDTAYPRAFRKLIEQHSRRAGVSPDLLQSLIREESGFNPKARSSTGALGLAQLMPATAALVAERLGTPHDESDLFRPPHNIRLGAAYLGSLQRQFDGNLVFAVASYNAGPAAVNAWIRRLGAEDIDAWVEDVPVEETREYVKRVLGSMAIYKWKTASVPSIQGRGLVSSSR